MIERRDQIRFAHASLLCPQKSRVLPQAPVI
jgi:hypothetical protein